MEIFKATGKYYQQYQMNTKTHLTGIILAGGQSRRMGKDKSFLKIEGSGFINRIIKTLEKLVDEIIIVANTDEYQKLGYRCVSDIFKNSGPLAGLHAGLTASTTQLNVVVACDMPLISSQLLKKMILMFKTEYDVLWCYSEENEIPLLGIYQKNMMKVCEDLLINNEKRVLQLTQVRKIQHYKVSKEEVFLVQNINTPQQYDQLKNEYRG